METLKRWLRTALVVSLVAVASGFAALAWLWQTRAEPTDIPLPVAAAAEDTTDRVTVTWLGISTLLFDDGETQVLTDGTISRFSLADILLFRPIESDFASINYVLDEYRINRLAAIIPLHSHFDHVIDAGHVANRTGAMILGSESTANVARGSKVPVDQYQTLQFGEARFFGDFTITLFESRHVPQLPDGEHWFPGIIGEPLSQPAPVNAWQAGAAYTVLIEHPAGSVLVQGSAGFVEGAGASHQADVAMISIAGLAGQGMNYTRDYWQEMVVASGATRVYPIHFDDFTQPFGELALFPDIVDDVVASSSWLRQLADDGEHQVDLVLPPLGRPFVLF